MIAYYKDNGTWEKLPCISSTYLNYDFETSSDTSPFRVPYSASIQCRLTYDLVKLLNLPTHVLSSPTQSSGYSTQRKLFLCFCKDIVENLPSVPTSCGYAFLTSVTSADINLSYSDITSDIIKDVLSESTGLQSGEAEGKKRTLADICEPLRFTQAADISLLPSHVYNRIIKNDSKTYDNALGNILLPLLHSSYGWGEGVDSTIASSRWHTNDYSGGQCTSTLPITMGSLCTSQIQPILPIYKLILWCNNKLSTHNITIDTTAAPTLCDQAHVVGDVGHLTGYGIALPLFTDACSSSPNDDLLSINEYNFVPNDKVQNLCSTKYGQLRFDSVSEQDPTYYEFVMKIDPNALINKSSDRAMSSNHTVYLYPGTAPTVDAQGFPTNISEPDCYVFTSATIPTHFHFRHDYWNFTSSTISGVRHVYLPPITYINIKWFIKDNATSQWVDASTNTQVFYNAFKADRLESIDGTWTPCGNIQAETWSYWQTPRVETQASGWDKLDNPDRVQPSCVVKGPTHDHFDMVQYLKKSDTPLEYLSKIVSFFHVSCVPEYTSVTAPDAFSCTFKLFQYDSITTTSVNGTLTSLMPSPYTGSIATYTTDSAKDYFSEVYRSTFPKTPWGSMAFKTGIHNYDTVSASDSKAITPSYVLVQKYKKKNGINLSNPWHYGLGQGCANIKSPTVLTCAFDEDNRQVDLHNAIFALFMFDGTRDINTWNDAPYTQQLVMCTRPDYSNTTDESPANPNVLHVAISKPDGTGWQDFAPDFNTVSDTSVGYPLEPNGSQSVYRSPMYRSTIYAHPVSAIYIPDSSSSEAHIIDFVSYSRPKILYGDFSLSPSKVEVFNPENKDNNLNCHSRTNWKLAKFSIDLQYVPSAIPAKLLVSCDGCSYNVMVKKLEIDPLGINPTTVEGYVILDE